MRKNKLDFIKKILRINVKENLNFLICLIICGVQSAKNGTHGMDYVFIE